MRKTVYLVVIDGAGEFEDAFHVLKIAATSPQAAVDFAVSSKMGYGKRQDGNAFVVPCSEAASFKINDTSKKIACGDTHVLTDLPRQEAP
jgi:hypothetical protein